MNSPKTGKYAMEGASADWVWQGMLKKTMKY